MANRLKRMMGKDSLDMVKENAGDDREWEYNLWLAGSLASTLGAVLLVLFLDARLPEPLDRSAPPDRFIADIAFEHLVNLTSIGPRVAGSYENEVLAVNSLVAAIRQAARLAHANHRVDVDVFRADGAFDLSFLDGLNNIYRSVGMVVARVRSPHQASRRAVLLNCHYDTVPDSPGASDDGAGCAVLLEVLRALTASPNPLRYDVIFLLNGAEENIMQASHGFITQHPWAKAAKVFINIEACGAGGREVLFQAGPREPWLISTYAGAVPHPFASSIAQELFQSGLIPADTDFRVFRDFGGLSGLDMAWMADGYVYHTRLDAADRVPKASLQRTGDNVLALLRGILSSEHLESVEESATSPVSQPVYFDLLGLVTVSVGAPAAAAIAGALLLAAAARLWLDARRASAQLYIPPRVYLREVLVSAGHAAAAAAAAVAGGSAWGLLLSLSGPYMMWYGRPWLLLPMAIVPAVCAMATCMHVLQRRRPLAPLLRGHHAHSLALNGMLVCYSLALTMALIFRIRSGFLAALWLAGAAARGGAGAGLRAALSAPGAYLARDLLALLVPTTGRVGAAPGIDLVVCAAASAAALPAGAALLAAAAAAPPRAARLAAAACLASAAVVVASLLIFDGPYTADRPQRYMVFHTRRTLHPAPTADTDTKPAVEHFYWIPSLDANSPKSIQSHVPALSATKPMSAEECSSLVYCGAPYFLPVLGLVPRAAAAPAPALPAALRLAALQYRRLGRGARSCAIEVTVQGPSHIVIVVSPVAGATLSATSLQAGAAPRAARPAPRAGAAPPAAARAAYFYTLHDASPAPRVWNFNMTIESSGADLSGSCAALSIAGHHMSGGGGAPLGALLRSFPRWAAASGWPVDLHHVVL